MTVKRHTVMMRYLLVCLGIVALTVVVIVGTVRVALTPPPPARTAADITRDSLVSLAILEPYPACNPYDTRLDSLPGGCIRLDVDRRIVNGREFNDSNYLHLRVADAIGINPITCESDAWDIDRPIVRIWSCRDYFVDNLSHSLPYLVPQADALLHDIGRAFNDSLAARGGGAYRVKVTSVLRTESSVRRLRRRNGNAVGRSAHLYGTTFDLSYSNFACDADSLPRSTDDLRLLLSEILRDFRSRGRCYVKHERKQSCFHITVRPETFNNE